MAEQREMQLCPTCQGRGTHVNRAIDGNGITGAEMDELGEDFREDYFAGRFDVRCEECKGANVVPVPTPEEEEAATEKWMAEAEQRAEMRVGA